MNITYDVASHEVDLSGDTSDLRSLALLVRSGQGRRDVEEPAVGRDGSVALTAVSVETVPEGAVLVRVDVASRCLFVIGDAERLTVLADNLAAAAEADDGGHLHVDHFDDHPYLAEGSVPLVVARSD